MHQFQNGQAKTVAAIVPVTLAVIAAGWETPRQFDWAIPVYGEPLAIGVPARGTFALDALATAQHLPLGPGNYVAYLELDGVVSAPQTFQVPSANK